jgi:hypothetical protein
MFDTGQTLLLQSAAIPQQWYIQFVGDFQSDLMMVDTSTPQWQITVSAVEVAIP